MIETINASESWRRFKEKIKRINKMEESVEKDEVGLKNLKEEENMSSLKVPTCDQKIIVYCKDNHKLIGQVNITGYERFSDYYKKTDILDMYNVKGIQDDHKIFIHPYVAVERRNIIFAIPFEEE